MLFNSIPYILFLPLVFIIHWFVFSKTTGRQNLFLLFTSYFFYAWWDWRFLFLLFLSTCIDFAFGLLIYNRPKQRKLFLWLSVFNNLIILFFFKYYNFFVESAAQLLEKFGFSKDP